MWAIHSIAHVYHETLRPEEGTKFLNGNEAYWKNNASLGVHVSWHKALNHIAVGDNEAALAMFDDDIKPSACSSENDNDMIIPHWKLKPSFSAKMPFPMSDACSLLLRLDMDGYKPSSGSLSDRWRDIGQAYEGFGGDYTVFYDIHALIGKALSNNRSGAERLRDEIREQAALANTNPWSHDCAVARKVGVPLADATIAFVDGDYDECVRLLHPIRYECQDLLGASHAQKDIIDLILFKAATKSTRGPMLAKQLFEERLARLSSDALERSDNVFSGLQKGIMLH